MRSLLLPFALILLASPAAAQKLRGANVASSISPASIAELDAWNANFIRWQLHFPTDTSVVPTTLVNGELVPDQAAYIDWWYARLFDRLDYLQSHVLDEADVRGITVLVDLHTAPGTLTHQDGVFNSALHAATGRKAINDEGSWQRQLFMDTWFRIAERLGGEPNVWGYDLLNEPYGKAKKWNALAKDASVLVRSYDPDCRLVVESRLGDPAKFSKLEPTGLPKTIYSCHMYAPLVYTHSQIGSDGYDPAGEAWKYPGTIKGKFWDKGVIEAALAPVRQFQQAHGARILMGEFAAARWAKGSNKYMEHVIQVCESYNWDWTYHAFRESVVWNIELGNDPYNLTTELSNKKINMIKSYWASNQEK